MKQKTIFLFSMLLMLTTACSNPLGGTESIIDSGHHPGVPDTGITETPTPKGSEFAVSSGQRKQSTQGRFLVEGSIAVMSKEVRQVSASNNFHVYSNKQGEISSQEVQ